MTIKESTESGLILVDDRADVVDSIAIDAS